MVPLHKVQHHIAHFCAIMGEHNLYQQKESFKHKEWIVPFSSEIKIKGIIVNTKIIIFNLKLNRKLLKCTTFKIRHFEGPF